MTRVTKLQRFGGLGEIVIKPKYLGEAKNRQEDQKAHWEPRARIEFCAKWFPPKEAGDILKFCGLRYEIIKVLKRDGGTLVTRKL